MEECDNSELIELGTLYAAVTILEENIQESKMTDEPMKINYIQIDKFLIFIFGNYM